MSITTIDIPFVIMLVLCVFLVYRGKMGVGMLIFAVFFGLVFAGTTPGSEAGSWARETIEGAWTRIVN